MKTTTQPTKQSIMESAIERKLHNYSTDEEYYTHHPKLSWEEQVAIYKAKEEQYYKKNEDKLNELGLWLTMNRHSLSRWINETGMFGEVKGIMPAQHQDISNYSGKGSVMTILMEDGEEYVISIQPKKLNKINLSK